MKIGLAQTRPVKGNISQNIDNHVIMIDAGINNGTEAIFFPELSLTGYEPELVKDLAINIDDDRLKVFQNSSDKAGIIIGVGMPVKQSNGTSISMIIFQPRQPRQLYSKKYLHEDEYPFFVSGENTTCLMNNNIALAICYEISIPEHSKNAFKNGAKIYVASIAKTAEGMAKANVSLSAMAKDHNMMVLLSNCVGASDNFISAGQSAAWDDTGKLLCQLGDSKEGVLIIDTKTKAIIQL
jgi:predicted amidohydrolase